MFINRRKRLAVPHRVASQGNAKYCEPGLSSVIIIPHKYYMILPVMGVSAASVYYLSWALVWLLFTTCHGR